MGVFVHERDFTKETFVERDFRVELVESGSSPAGVDIEESKASLPLGWNGQHGQLFCLAGDISGQVS